MPRAFVRGSLKMTIKNLGSEINNISACSEECWKQYKEQCIYSQYNQGGSCYIAKTCSGSKCGQVADVNSKGRDYNRVMCANEQFVAAWKTWKRGKNELNKGPVPCSFISDSNKLMWKLSASGKKIRS